jgi:outer membrane protein TolC
MFALADQNSKLLKPAATGIREAQEAVRMAQNGRLPEVKASLSLSYLGDGYLWDRNFTNGMSAPIPPFGNNFSLEVQQVIWAGGAVRSGIELAKLQEQHAQLNLSLERGQVRFMLVGYYLDLFKQRNLLRVYETHIEQAQRLLKDMQVKEGAGVALKNDITRYELLLSQLELCKTQLQNTLAILNAQLVTTLGMPASTRLEPDTSLLRQALPTEDAGYWQSLAVDHSPALQQQQLAVSMNRQQDKMVRAERLPQLAFVANSYLMGPITIDVDVKNKNYAYWYAGLGLSYRIASLYKSGTAVRKSQLAIHRTQEQYEAAKEQIELTLHTDHIRYMEAYQQLSTQQLSLALAQQNYQLVSYRYANDLALITDLLDASTQQLNAELQLVNAQISIVYCYYKLKYFSGTL